MSNVKYVYTFGGKTAEGKADMKNLLGGKGANLAEMCLLGLPVPAGLTITTECCTAYYANNCQLPDTLMADVWKAMARGEAEYCTLVSDKALAVAGGVLEAIMHFSQKNAK